MAVSSSEGEPRCALQGIEALRKVRRYRAHPKPGSRTTPDGPAGRLERADLLQSRCHSRELSPDNVKEASLSARVGPSDRGSSQEDYGSSPCQGATEGSS